MKSSFLKIILVILFHCLLISSYCESIPFKMGFEFQETSSLCPWALHNSHIQKKELFSIKDEGKREKLWHVVIDGCDIEFITRPFTDKEHASLEQSIGAIVHSINTLREILQSKPEVSFLEWVNFLEHHPHTPLTIEKSETFESITSQMITRPSKDWNPRFSPQVTIQHPLEYAIPLYFGLFGFRTSPTLQCFVASLPFRDLLLEYHGDADAQNVGHIFSSFGRKVSGLLFLHSLTLVQMTPLSEDHDDKYFLEETAKNLTDFYQIDAKMRLTLMSRRPFSSMLEDIRHDLNGPYSTCFKHAMTHNTSFMRIFEVPSLLYKTNYAEQFFDEEGHVRPLQHLLDFFQDDFVEHNRERLLHLLKNGVIGTPMLRNLKEEHTVGFSLELLNKADVYFEASIKSVESPQKRFILSLETPRLVQEVPSRYDSLSPPWFLHLDNSMGAFKDDLSVKDKERYGEAIVEVRGIRHVEHWFLKKVELNPRIKDSFLTVPDENLTSQARKLFDFLNAFEDPRTINDIRIGMTYAIFKS